MLSVAVLVLIAAIEPDDDEMEGPSMMPAAFWLVILAGEFLAGVVLWGEFG